MFFSLQILRLKFSMHFFCPPQMAGHEDELGSLCLYIYITVLAIALLLVIFTFSLSELASSTYTRS